MGTDRAIHVIFTGQVRDPVRLRRTLRDLAALRAEGIVGSVRLSTWCGELADRELHEQLVAAGVQIIQSPDVPLPGIGNIWRQMRSLVAGLETPTPIPDDALVLKTRTDLRLDPTFIRELATDPRFTQDADPVWGTRTFKQKIWVPWFEITKPFYLADECFFGLAADIRRITHEDIAWYEAIPSPGCGVTHQRRFLHPFRDLHPHVMAGYGLGNVVGLLGPDRDERLASLLSDESYLDLLAAYYAILRTHFVIGSGRTPQPIEFREWSSGSIGVRADAFTANFRRERSWNPEFGHIYAYDERWLEYLAGGRLDAEPAARSIAQRIAEFTSAVPSSELVRSYRSMKPV